MRQATRSVVAAGTVRTPNRCWRESGVKSFRAVTGLLAIAALPSCSSTTQVHAQQPSSVELMDSADHTQTPRAVPDDRDREVIEATLLYFLASPEFRMVGGNSGGAMIGLDSRPQGGTGPISAYQIRSELGEGHTIPAESEIDLWNRNVNLNTGEIILPTFSGLTFDHQVLTVDLDAERGKWPIVRPFGDTHPEACGWVSPWLPGYSKDGLRAVVRAWVGPSYHGTAATIFLERRGGRWMVQWHHFAFFA